MEFIDYLNQLGEKKSLTKPNLFKKAIHSKSRSRSRSLSNEKKQILQTNQFKIMVNQVSPQKENSSLNYNSNEIGTDQKNSQKKRKSKFDIKPKEYIHEFLKYSDDFSGTIDKIKNNQITPDFMQRSLTSLKNLLKTTYPPTEKSHEVKPQYQYIFQHARRLYIGNIPFYINEEYMNDWLYRTLETCGGLVEKGNPIINLKINENSKFCFLELRSIEETTALLQLDGLFLWNYQLRIRRPERFQFYKKVQGTRPVPKLNLQTLEDNGTLIIPTYVEKTENKIFLANLPQDFDDLTIVETLEIRKFGFYLQQFSFLTNFRDLKAFHLVKDSTTFESKGFAFFEYNNYEVTNSTEGILYVEEQ